MTVRSLLESIPCPRSFADALDAYTRQRVLVLQIEALSDRKTAFYALCAARAAFIFGGNVEASLRLIREALARGAKP